MDSTNGSSSQPDEVPSTSTTSYNTPVISSIKIEDGKPGQPKKNEEEKNQINYASSSSSTASEEGGRSEEEEEFYRPPEPDYSRANSLQFYDLAKRFEAVWAQLKRSASSNRNIKRLSKDDLLAHLLPKTLLKFMKGGSPFPVLRLMMPDKDNVRPHSGMKEKMIASVWGDAIG